MERKLIQEVQKHPCIYNRRIPAYRSKRDKEKAWAAVEAGVGAKLEQCQARWKSLRDRFVREASKQTKSDGGSPVKEWRFMEQLSFLRNHIERRQKSITIDETEGKEVKSNSDSPPASSMPRFLMETVEDPLLPAEDASSKKNRSSAKTEANERFNSLVDVISKFVEKSTSGRSISSKNIDFVRILDKYLNQLTDDEAERTKMQVLNLVYERTVANK